MHLYAIYIITMYGHYNTFIIIIMYTGDKINDQVSFSLSLSL